MLSFFRTYQKSFFSVIAAVVIASSFFFGTAASFVPEPEVKRVEIGKTLNGSALVLSDVQELSRFLSSDCNEAMFPNFCNDGVVRKDFLEGKLADLLAAAYFDTLKDSLSVRLEKVKRFQPYAHPEQPALNARAVWQRLVPGMNEEMAILQESSVDLSAFSRLTKLYLLQQKCPPQTLRRILFYQLQQFSDLRPDARLLQEDLSLFGFRTTADWFGKDFIDLVSQFILNGAAVAEKKGYQVSLEEAKGDLIHQFSQSVKRVKNADVNFSQHLRSLGFDEAKASQLWKKVLLFRKYFQEVGSCAFVDNLAHKEIANYANQGALIRVYRGPVALRTAQDVAEFHFYVKAVSASIEHGFPTSYLSAEEVEKKFPALVKESFRAQVAEVSGEEIGLLASMKQVRAWQIEHWQKLQSQFSLPSANTETERFAILDRMSSVVDPFSRKALVEEHPEWVEQALAKASLSERTWDGAFAKRENVYYRIEGLEKLSKRILSFVEARDVLRKLTGKVEGVLQEKEHPFLLLAKKALPALSANPEDARYIQAQQDPIVDQFKFFVSESEIRRTSKEGWMKEQVFSGEELSFSPLRVEESGEVVFFYMKQKQSAPPLLEHISFGHATLSSDAKMFAAKKLLKSIQQVQAIVIPLQKED